jgi:hypothetical protein
MRVLHLAIPTPNRSCGPFQPRPLRPPVVFKPCHGGVFAHGSTALMAAARGGCEALGHRQGGVWHEAGFVDFGLASCSREFPRLRASARNRDAPTWPSEAPQGTKPGVMGCL